MNEFIKKWLDTNYQKFLTHNQPLEESVMTHILDWMNSSEGASYLPKLYKMTVPVVIQVADKWTESMNRKNAKEIAKNKLLEGVEVIKTFSNNYKIVKLVNPESYMIEGVKMGHCVGSYHDRDVEIYSLRDQHNEPHCTIEFDPKRSKICQIKGKANLAVVSKYHQYIADFLNEFNFERIFSHDLKNICSIYFGSYIFLNNQMPENLTINKNLTIEATNFVHTFNCLTVKGDMFLSKNRRCRKIASTLVIEGDLVIEEFHGLLRVADKLVVKGVIEITNCESLKILADQIEAESICVVDCYNFTQKINQENFDLIYDRKVV